MKKWYKKIMAAFKAMLLKWLGVDVQLQLLESKIRTANNKVTKLNKQMEVVYKLIDVGVEIGYRDDRYSRSWAVVCLGNGDKCFVDMFNLSPDDIQQIGNFLRQFDRRNIKIDAPRGMAKYIREYNRL